VHLARLVPVSVDGLLAQDQQARKFLGDQHLVQLVVEVQRQADIVFGKRP
jgi:hypothetical protein